MRILFGMYLDGAVWSSQTSCIGEVRTGPWGLLTILETHLGLSGLSVHPATRIDEYLQRLEKIDHDSAWFHESLAVDPWSTARQLLAWRDELIAGGWQAEPKPRASVRLNALTDLENVALPLSAGRADRLREIIRRLQQNFRVPIDSIELLEPMELLPPVWQEIIKLLQNQGTSVHMRQQPSNRKQASNLTYTQAFLEGTGNNHVLTVQDDSLILLKAGNEWEAAEHLALWLASQPQANEQVTIVCGSDTDILDQALRRHGLPRLGRSEASRWREVQQILPLMLANAWKPVDIRLLAELLALTASPLPRWVCRTLLNAINEEPGVGGRAWNKALETIEARYKEELEEKKDTRSAEKARAFVEEINNLLVEERFDPADGIPEDNLRRRCQKVITWLGWRLDKDPMLVEVVGQARQLQELARGKGKIPRITLERMLDTIIGAGSYADDRWEEAASWHVVDHPGEVVDLCNEIIWWGFNDPMTKPPAYWTDQERIDLLAEGVQLEKSKDFRCREASAWQQAFKHTKKRFMAVHITQMDGEETFHHPFWDTICYAAAGNKFSDEEVSACLVRECKDYECLKEWEFAGRKQTLQDVPEQKPAEYIASYTVSPAVIKPPDKLSYSQMSTMISCPMKWALQYHAGLRLSESQTIPSNNQMLGTLCHRIVEELYSSGKQWGPDEAASETAHLYDQLLPSMASELLLEGNAIENLRCRLAIIEAVRQLVESINHLNLTVEKTEALLQAQINEIPFIGYADLLLRDTYGHSFILDLKWSYSSKYYRQEIEEGSALQLATYARMLRTAETDPKVHAGYFMLAQGQFISDSPLLADDAIDSQYTLEEVWDMAWATLKNELQQLADGNIEARGISELLAQSQDGKSEEQINEIFREKYLANGMLYRKPPCRYCDYSVLCGL